MQPSILLPSTAPTAAVAMIHHRFVLRYGIAEALPQSSIELVTDDISQRFEEHVESVAKSEVDWETHKRAAGSRLSESRAQSN